MLPHSQTHPVLHRTAILHLIAPTHFGGAENVVLNVVDRIDRSRFTVHVASFVNAKRRQNEFVEGLKARGIPNTVFWLKRTADLDNLLPLIRLIKANNVQVIHTHGYRADIIGLMAAKATGCRIVSTVHGWTAIDARLRLYERLDRLALRYFDALLPVSDRLRDDLTRFNIDTSRILRIHNAVDTEFMDVPILEPIHGRDQARFLIGAIGRLSQEKNLENFLQATKILVENHGEAGFMIVGDGPERESLERLTDDLGLRHFVSFTGFIKDLEDIYDRLDILVISSKTEGIPLVLLEAMKYGIPAVCTRVGGIPEVIDDGAEGILVEPGRPEAIAQAVERLMEDRVLYRSIAENAKKKVAERFSLTQWIQQIEGVYARLAAKNGQHDKKPFAIAKPARAGENNHTSYLRGSINA